MAHMIDMTRGSAAFAYTGEECWHKLGNKMDATASLDEWLVSAGMDWEIRESDVMFSGIDGVIGAVPDKKVLYRGDSGDALSVVGDSYHIVQPKDVMEFFRDVVSGTEAHIETAGCLFGGRRFYALANLNREEYVGVKDDITKGYLLLTTSCDMSTSTQALATSIRVCCANTMAIALGSNSTDRVKVSHRTQFDADLVKSRLGSFDTAWGEYITRVNQMAAKKVSDSTVSEVFQKLVYSDPVKPSPQSVTQYDQLMSLYRGAGIGSEMAYGNLYGALNAVTELVDHHSRVRTDDRKFVNKFYGAGDKMKQDAFDLLLSLA